MDKKKSCNIGHWEQLTVGITCKHPKPFMVEKTQRIKCLVDQES